MLFVSDSPNGPNGLGMITREIATRAQKHLADVCYVGVAGYGDDGSKKQPFPVYPFSELKNWTIPQLPWIWKQFSGDRKGIIVTVWNIAWLPWFAYPEELEPSELRDFLMSDRFKLWAYVPVDSVCLNDGLSNHEERILRRLDRVLAYTKFGADAIDRTLGNQLGTTEHIPHGTDDTIFYPRSRKTARETMLQRIGYNMPGAVVGDEIEIIGIFATNTARKDFPIALEVCARLVQRGHNIGVLLHTNRMVGDWNITELCLKFGLKGRVFESTRPMTDHRDVAWLYAACDVVLCPGRGEGWGSPCSESLACGVPIVTGNYAGSMEFVPSQYAVEPIAYQYESVFSNKRPVHNPEAWVEKVEKYLPFRDAPRKSLLGSEWMWPQVWNKWEAWFRRGLEGK
jgi:glycosyltransferase involved in cell wall biosynthesis